MSKLEIKIHKKLLKEASEHLKNVKPIGVVLTEEHLAEWLGVFYDEHILLDGCNKDKVKY